MEHFERETDNHHIVIFDGVCNFCNGAVNFIIKRDPKRVFLFTPMHSPRLSHGVLQYLFKIPVVQTPSSLSGLPTDKKSQSYLAVLARQLKKPKRKT